MDLSLATIEQITEELQKRPIEFALVVSSSEDGEHSEETDYQIYSSFTEVRDECSLQEAVHCLLGSLTVLGTLGGHLEDNEDPRAEGFWRWQGAGETLLRDIFRTVHDWTEGDEEDDGAVE